VPATPLSRSVKFSKTKRTLLSHLPTTQPPYLIGFVRIVAQLLSQLVDLIFESFLLFFYVLQLDPGLLPRVVETQDGLVFGFVHLNGDRDPFLQFQYAILQLLDGLFAMLKAQKNILRRSNSTLFTLALVLARQRSLHIDLKF
jgi:hypothetical protein